MISRGSAPFVIATLAAACHGQSATQPDARGDAGPTAAEQRTSMEGSAAAAARYRTHLASIGYTQPGERAVEVSGLRMGEVHFFGYEEGGLRLKAAVTPTGIVTPGAQAEDDWLGFLSSAPDAATAAQRIAWLESDEAARVDPPPSRPVVALAVDPRPDVGMDPAHWGLVTAPTLRKSGNESATLVAWLLPDGARVPVRWTVVARPGAPAEITRASAAEIWAAQSGETAPSAVVRARKVLASGTDDERFWALLRIGEAGDRAAVPDVAALLGNKGASRTSRVMAAGTLATLADPAAVSPLGAALRGDPDDSVRRQCAQSLGRIHGAEAVQALAAAASKESVVGVRIEIVHALSAQGARSALDTIARTDADASVRQLARHYVDAMR